MGKFVYFTSAEKRQANEVDLPSFLLDRGEKLIMAGRDYRLVSDHSITVRGPMWYDHAARKGGRAISFVQQFYDKTYPEAVTMLLGRDGQGIIPIVKKEPESREPKPFTPTWPPTGALTATWPRRSCGRSCSTRTLCTTTVCSWAWTSTA